MASPVRHLRFPFGIALIGGTAAEEPDYDAYVRQLIRQVLLTARGERVCRPDFGAGLRRQVFAPLNDTSAALTRTLVYEALVTWLGTLIRVEQVTVRAEAETLRVSVEYLTIARGERRLLDEDVVL
jgi:phage baseplate assembly protein W